jgi:hypothetical protein
VLETKGLKNRVDFRSRPGNLEHTHGSVKDPNAAGTGNGRREDTRRRRQRDLQKKFLRTMRRHVINADRAVDGLVFLERERAGEGHGNP